MQKIKISSARSIVAKNQYKNELITWDALKARFFEPKRTKGTMQQYHMEMGKDQQAIEKNASGGYVGGWLEVNEEKSNLNRGNDTILIRTLLTYDFDNCKKGYDEQMIDELNATDYAFILYTTHSHTPKNPRFRVIIPLSREVTPEEYEAIARRFIAVKMNGIPETLDSSTFQPARVMFYPTAPSDSEFYVNEWADGNALDADAVLKTYQTTDYKNEWELHPSEQAKTHTLTRPTGNFSDPRQKPSYIGAFNRVYNIHDAIGTFINDKYIAGKNPDRYTWAEGSMADGAVVYSDFSPADFLHSSHDTDPAKGQNNAFDLVRIHRYGHLDVGHVGNINELPSQKVMIELCKSLPEVIKEYQPNSATPEAPKTPTNDAIEKEIIKEEIAKIDFENATINDISEKLVAHLNADQRKRLYQNTSPFLQLENFKKQLDKDAGKPVIKTGFNKLDNLLDGGLYSGLYFIGAISSLGKTTFLLQVADQIAKQGKDVLIFSLEMSRFEVMAKSLSRITHELSKEDNNEYYYMTDGRQKKIYNARTLREITDKRRYNTYTDYQRELIERAYNKYGTYAKNVFIHAGIGSINIDKIKQTVADHTEMAEEAPVVIIDYLQIIAPDGSYKDIRGSLDMNVTALKSMSVKYDTPVIAISSLNRESYKSSISMTAFKESGGIEYSSDVLIGLQFAKQREIDTRNAAAPLNKQVSLNHDEEKLKTPRQIELKVLKQRNGAPSGSIDYNYNAKFNHYEEMIGTFKTGAYDIQFIDEQAEKKPVNIK